MLQFPGTKLLSVFHILEEYLKKEILGDITKNIAIAARVRILGSVSRGNLKFQEWPCGTLNHE